LLKVVGYKGIGSGMRQESLELPRYKPSQRDEINSTCRYSSNSMKLIWPQGGAKETAPDAPTIAAREPLTDGTKHAERDSQQEVHGG